MLDVKKNCLLLLLNKKSTMKLSIQDILDNPFFFDLQRPLTNNPKQINDVYQIPFVNQVFDNKK